MREKRQGKRRQKNDGVLLSFCSCGVMIKKKEGERKEGRKKKRDREEKDRRERR